MRLVTGVGSDGVIGFRHAGQNTTGALPACLSIDAPQTPRCLQHQPGPEKADDQIRSGPSPHFPGPFYKQYKGRGQVTSLTEFGLASEPQCCDSDSCFAPATTVCFARATFANANNAAPHSPARRWPVVTVPPSPPNPASLQPHGPASVRPSKRAPEAASL
jgi:hypothetical protein